LLTPWVFTPGTFPPCRKVGILFFSSLYSPDGDDIGFLSHVSDNLSLQQGDTFLILYFGPSGLPLNFASLAGMMLKFQRCFDSFFSILTMEHNWCLVHALFWELFGADRIPTNSMRLPSLSWTLKTIEARRWRGLIDFPLRLFPALKFFFALISPQ